ncbi:DUF2946 family protein [Novosphingobium album (ex Liu et al. 2023)]|uniref:DUF2946 domain-containing protein n=1 Tax=Novosphingobium album (ex Liu et al. 2023) TaxID=3031130 RepID=A0ABT5WRH4_9SPHN|nr:DUF2946 family protein [Novosphingobium album (ex Liu et al. 2023)]MDE8652655.1 hypothetical protein [Novosphingobium album (ex Liu et al. 2023)]
MHAIRRLLGRHPALAACLVAGALLLKVLVPAGFMPVVQSGTVTVALCSSAGAGGMTITIPTRPDNGAHDGQHGGDPQQATDHPCAFAPLSGPALASADPALLLAAILFVFVAAIFRHPLVLPRSGAQLRPPLRGPPLTA